MKLILDGVKRIAEPDSMPVVGDDMDVKSMLAICDQYLMDSVLGSLKDDRSVILGLLGSLNKILQNLLQRRPQLDVEAEEVLHSRLSKILLFLNECLLSVKSSDTAMIESVLSEYNQMLDIVKVPNCQSKEYGKCEIPRFAVTFQSELKQVYDGLVTACHAWLQEKNIIGTTLAITKEFCTIISRIYSCIEKLPQRVHYNDSDGNEVTPTEREQIRGECVRKLFYVLVQIIYRRQMHHRPHRQ
jgi:hypothetical protein